MNPLFTIGHSTHELLKFLALLEMHRIDAVADVRSSPRSGRFPWFSQEPLEKALRKAGIRYVFLGEELGARREDPNCYVGRRADYHKIADSAKFREGLDRIRKGLEDYRIALMCAERDPLDCHRTILVCRHARRFADIFHIKADGTLESHPDVESRLMDRCGSHGDDLFQSREAALDGAYDRRGLEIAWTEPEANTVTHEP
jgi:uncharacterized protein (DUF488 family)